MKIQTSFEEETAATLYVVPTPIGNLEDMTYRAVHTLRRVSLIAAEDTRNTKRLLHYFDISTGLISYHEHNKASREQELLQKLETGESVAIVSDAGMPAISDPGGELVEAAIKADYPVVVLPGANAALCALVGSGLPAKEFLFYGFLPRKAKEKAMEVKRIGSTQATILLYESPYRLVDTLSVLEKQLGDRRIAIARELTKKFETYIRGLTSEVTHWAKENEVKGECCIVIEGTQAEAEQDELWWSHLSIVEHIEYYMKESAYSSKDAIKEVARERHLSKRTVYQAYHIDAY